MSTPRDLPSKEWPSLQWTFRNQRRNGESTGYSDFTCLLLITKSKIRDRLPRVPVQDWVPGSVGIPTFHCKQCLQHWKMFGDVTEECDQPKEIAHGPPMFITCNAIKKTSMPIRNAFIVNGNQLHVSVGTTKRTLTSGLENPQKGADNEQPLKNLLWEDSFIEGYESGLTDEDGLLVTSASPSTHTGALPSTCTTLTGSHSNLESSQKVQKDRDQSITLPAITDRPGSGGVSLLQWRLSKTSQPLHGEDSSLYPSRPSSRADSEQAAGSDCFTETNVSSMQLMRGKIRLNGESSKGCSSLDLKDVSERAFTSEGIGSESSALVANVNTSAHQPQQEKATPNTPTNIRQSAGCTKKDSDLSHACAAWQDGKGGSVGASTGTGDRGTPGRNNQYSTAVTYNTQSANNSGAQHTSQSVVKQGKAAATSKENASKRSSVSSKQRTMHQSKLDDEAALPLRKKKHSNLSHAYAAWHDGMGGSVGSDGGVTGKSEPGHNSQNSTAAAVTDNTPSANNSGAQHTNQRVLRKGKAAATSKENAPQRSHVSSKQWTTPEKKFADTAAMPVHTSKHSESDLSHAYAAWYGKMGGSVGSSAGNTGSSRPYTTGKPDRNNQHSTTVTDKASNANSSGTHHTNQRVVKKGKAAAATSKENAPERSHVSSKQRTSPESKLNDTATMPMFKKVQGEKGKTRSSQISSDSGGADSEEIQGNPPSSFPSVTLPEITGTKSMHLDVDSSKTTCKNDFCSVSMPSRLNSNKFEEGKKSSGVCLKSKCGNRKNELNHKSHPGLSFKEQLVVDEYYKVVKPTSLFASSDLTTRSFTYSLFSVSKQHNDTQS